MLPQLTQLTTLKVHVYYDSYDSLADDVGDHLISIGLEAVKQPRAELLIVLGCIYKDEDEEDAAHDELADLKRSWRRLKKKVSSTRYKSFATETESY